MRDEHGLREQLFKNMVELERLEDSHTRLRKLARAVVDATDLERAEGQLGSAVLDLIHYLEESHWP